MDGPHVFNTCIVILIVLILSTRYEETIKLYEIGILVLIILSREGSSSCETVGAIESVGVNGSDRVWSAIIGRLIIESGTHMAVGNQRAALINKQLDGVRRGEARRGVTRHFIIHSHAVT